MVALEKGPDDATSRRRYMTAASKFLDHITVQSIGYETILHEQATARRLFMIVAQFLKYIDPKTPIRFLIAESDTPFTVLAALCYAKMLKKHGVFEGLNRIEFTLREDLMYLRDGMKERGMAPAPYSLSAEERKHYTLLHVVRMGLIPRIFLNLLVSPVRIFMVINMKISRYLMRLK